MTYSGSSVSVDALAAVDATNPAPKKKRNRKRKQKVSPPPSDQDSASIDADNQEEKEKELEKELNELKLEVEETSKVVDGSDTFLDQQQHQGQEESPKNSLSDDDDDDGGEWITPKNVVQRKQLDAFGCISSSKAPEQVTVACITNDFAMQVIKTETRNICGRHFNHPSSFVEHFASNEIISLVC